MPDELFSKTEPLKFTWESGGRKYILVAGHCVYVHIVQKKSDPKRFSGCSLIVNHTSLPKGGLKPDLHTRAPDFHQNVPNTMQTLW